MSKPLIFELLKVPAEALMLSAHQRALLIQLLDNYNPKLNGVDVWPSIATLAQLTGQNPKTARACRQKLAELGYIKIYRDRGKSDVCAINVDCLRELAARYQGGRIQTTKPDTDPSQKREGCYPQPIPKTVGDPYQIREGTSPKNGTLMTKEGPMNNLGHSDCPDDRPEINTRGHQRNLAIHSVISEAVRSLSVGEQEQPTKKKSWKDDRAEAVRSVRDSQ